MVIDNFLLLFPPPPILSRIVGKLQNFGFGPEFNVFYIRPASEADIANMSMNVTLCEPVVNAVVASTEAEFGQVAPVAANAVLMDDYTNSESAD